MDKPRTTEAIQLNRFCAMGAGSGDLVEQRGLTAPEAVEIL